MAEHEVFLSGGHLKGRGEVLCEGNMGRHHELRDHRQHAVLRHARVRIHQQNELAHAHVASGQKGVLWRGRLRCQPDSLQRVVLINASLLHAEGAWISDLELKCKVSAIVVPWCKPGVGLNVLQKEGRTPELFQFCWLGHPFSKRDVLSKTLTVSIIFLTSAEQVAQDSVTRCGQRVLVELLDILHAAAGMLQLPMLTRTASLLA